MSVTGVGGTFAGVFGLKMWGKRKVYLIALVGVTSCTLFLCKFFLAFSYNFFFF